MAPSALLGRVISNPLKKRLLLPTTYWILDKTEYTEGSFLSLKKLRSPYQGKDEHWVLWASHWVLWASEAHAELRQKQRKRTPGDAGLRKVGLKTKKTARKHPGNSPVDEAGMKYMRKSLDYSQPDGHRRGWLGKGKDQHFCSRIGPHIVGLTTVLSIDLFWDWFEWNI